MTHVTKEALTRKRLLIHGYVRRSYHNPLNADIPVDVIIICHLFYEPTIKFHISLENTDQLQTQRVDKVISSNGYELTISFHKASTFKQYNLNITHCNENNLNTNIQCPQCKSFNVSCGGYGLSLHKQCIQCRYHYCGLCSGPWNTHGAGTGGYYDCNRVAEPKTKFKNYAVLDYEIYCLQTD
eukprot:479603_1